MQTQTNRNWGANWRPVPIKNYSEHEYLDDDFFYDIESLANIFTVAFFNPKKHYVILSYIDDSGMLNKPGMYDYIRNHTYNSLHNFNGPIYFEDLTIPGKVSKNPHDPVNLNNLGFYTFVKRIGFTTFDKHINTAIEDRGDDTHYNHIFHTIHDTDPDYDPNLHGLRLGYNSTNYDMTMLALLLDQTSENLNEEQPFKNCVIAQDMRDENDKLFNQYKSQMPNRLQVDIHPNHTVHNFKSNANGIYRGWKTSGRYLDVSNFNESQSKVGLKRIMGILGLPIFEPTQLDDDTTLHTTREFADLIAYNIADTVNLRWVFQHQGAYYSTYSTKKSLLKDYPETIYRQNKKADGYQPYTPDHPEAHLNVKWGRQTADSTSARFVADIIAPYNVLEDNEVVDFMYPSEENAKRHNIKRRDVLEETRKWFEENVANEGEAYEEFMEVYNFYSEIRGKNFNGSKDHIERFDLQPDTFPDDVLNSKTFAKELMEKYNTNLFYYNRDTENGSVKKSSTLATFSIGGIHGVEVKLDKFLEDEAEHQAQLDELQQVKDMFNGDALQALNNGTYIELNGEKRKIRDFLKKANIKKQIAEWKSYKKVALFGLTNGKSKLKNQYKYVSSGESSHEDFESYYPLLLSMLGVFQNPERGTDKDGYPIDPYYKVYEKRSKYKKLAKDTSYSKLERDSFNQTQVALKLILNSASGVADGTFDTNVRVNNKAIAMRAIGQMFAWRIGQAQALAGAKIPSTNTDGLYTMDISAELNDQILDKIKSTMNLSITPERLTKLISKDSNSRVEIEGNEIVAASSGSVRSYNEPSPSNSIDHPAIVDRLLVNYLKDKEYAVNQPFDKAFAQQLYNRVYQELIHDTTKTDKPLQNTLRFYQWIVASSPSTNQYVFLQRLQAQNLDTETFVDYSKLNNDNVVLRPNHDDVSQAQLLQHYNRVFLVNQYQAPVALYKARPYKRAKQSNPQERVPVSEYVLKQNGYDIHHGSHLAYDATINKVTHMPEHQTVELLNTSIFDLTEYEAGLLLNRLDHEAYLSMLETSFTKTWCNLTKQEIDALTA